jgi:hypothetical protein
MANCCKTNTCVDITPSACVKYTGTPTTGGLIDKQDYCDPYLNEIITLFDDTLTSLDTRVGLNKTTFDNINEACGLYDVINTSGLTVKNDKYYSSEVVIELVKVICELRSNLNYLTSQNINTLGTGGGVIHWQDLELKGTLKALVGSSCFIENPCAGTPIVTLGDLLETLVTKVCDLITATNCLITTTNSTCTKVK